MANVCTLGEPLDPTPLSVVQHEYATQIDYLLSAVTVPGLTQEQLSTFKTSNRSFAFVCRFSGCTGMLAGFPTDDLRAQHEMTHKPALFCTHSGCKYSLPFASQQSLRRHMREFHDSVPRSTPKSIRRRQAMLLREGNGYPQTPNPQGSVDSKRKLSVKDDTYAPRPPKRKQTTLIMNRYCVSRPLFRQVQL
jgi:hypothetical protein